MNKSTSISKVSIKIQTGVYGQFRNLQNKVWFALGEYVDNAVQSYETNKAKLKKTNGAKYQFEVRININWEKDEIVIFDNAAGIDSKNLLRAFEPANIPIDNTGLHEFGMGMKTASVWLANIWSVRTAALGEKMERLIEFDLKKVLKEKKEELEVKNQPKEENTHFTKITLKKMSKNAPTVMQVDKIRKHLASIYRKFIRSGELKLYINDVEPLAYNDPDILIAPFHSNPKGKPIKWKKEIDFSSDRYKAKGFIAILNTMSTNEFNGLSLFRRGRVIEGSHDEKYRPKSICGHIGSPRYKRIFGELELEGFNVSFNKGSFQEQEDLEALMDSIQVEISAKGFDLYTQAERYIKQKTQDDNVKVAKNIVSKLIKSTKSENLNDKVDATLKDIDDKVIATKNDKLSKRANSIGSHEDVINIHDKSYRLKVDLITEKSITDLYRLEIDTNDPASINYKINLAHPFFNKFDKFKTDEDYEPIISIIRSLVLAEIISPSQGTKNAGNIRLNFNRFLKNI